MDTPKALTILAVAALLVTAFICGRISGQISAPAPTVDTLTVRDTIRVPGPRDTLWLRTIDTMLVEVPVVLRDTDTIRVPVTLPREQLAVRDTAFTAWVSGYRPALDSIEIYTTTTTITKQLPAPRWSIGIQGGVGITPKGVQPYLGVGVSYRIPLDKR